MGTWVCETCQTRGLTLSHHWGHLSAVGDKDVKGKEKGEDEAEGLGEKKRGWGLIGQGLEHGVGVGAGGARTLTKVVAAKASREAAKATRATTRKMMVPLTARRRSLGWTPAGSPWRQEGVMLWQHGGGHHGGTQGDTQMDTMGI